MNLFRLRNGNSTNQKSNERPLLVIALVLACCVLSPAAQAQTAVNLNVLWRVVVNGTDRMTTVDPSERDLFPLEGQLFYVPQSPMPGETPLYRLLNFTGTDHADSTTAVKGYAVEGPLGFPWDTKPSVPGLIQLFEGFDRQTGDHALVRPDEFLPGYAPKALGVYGYGRFGNLEESLVSLSAGGVTIKSNRVAGGTLWRWFWNGVQFVNTYDYGREIQSAFCFNGCDANPTEAGDTFSSPSTAPGVRHGSPLLVAKNLGSTQITRAIPLQFDPSGMGGGPANPVVWSDIGLGKDITLDFHDMGSVAKYTTHLSLPTATTGSFELLTPYLRAVFTRFWTYDAETETLTEVTSQMPDACIANDGYFFRPQFGGVIVSDNLGTYAMGEYGVNTSQGGSVSSLVLFKYICTGDGTAESSFDTVKLDAVRGNDLNFPAFPAGDSTYTAYLMTDNLEGVVSKMNQLFQMGVR